MELTRQVEIIHLSDLHFGSKHRFLPIMAPDGGRTSAKGMPSLREKLIQDLQGVDPGCPVVVCVTGDVTTTGSFEEFKSVTEFVAGMADSLVLGRKRAPEFFFVVPGNHDLNYAVADLGERWQQWNDFYNRTFGTNLRTTDPLASAGIRELPDSGLLVVMLNSSVYVQKDTANARRGELDTDQLDSIQRKLEKIPKARRESYVKIALIHHHPVLIPALVEGDRGYDAVLNSDRLLSILRQFGFHLILHGHKHTPYVFLEDAAAAFVHDDDQPLLVVAGGSLGSTELPDHPRKANCYNRITVKWHPAARQARVRVRTRSLVMFSDRGRPRLPTRWTWTTLKEVDRTFRGDPLPEPSPAEFQRLGRPTREDPREIARLASYRATRYNLPVVEIRPSLTTGQAYEAVFWIEQHGKADVPVEVTWSAGPSFETFTVNGNAAPRFAGRYDFWGPMLIQAQLLFADGAQAHAHIYARLPNDGRRIKSTG